MGRLRAGVLGLWTLAVLSSAAWAEEEQLSARGLFERGVSQFEAGDYEHAARSFRQSFEANPVPIALYNYGMSLRELFRFAESIDALEQYLALGADQISTERAQEARRLIEDMNARLGTARIVVEPTTATVLVDGEEVEPDQLSALRLRAGPHQVVARAEGFAEASEMVQVEAQHLSEVRLRLEPTDPAEPAGIPAEPEPPVADLEPPPEAPPRGEGEEDSRRLGLWIGILSGVAAAAALGFGLGFGLQNNELPESDLRMDLP